MTTDYREQVETERQQKEQYFAEHPHSPVSEGFAGLEFFPVDPAYRYELTLHEYDEKEAISVETTAGGEQTYLTWGEFRFEVGGEPVVLQAYRSDPDDERLWVPFRDATSGEETYGAGRYLDLEPDDFDGERWTLDLNRAYNPTCAYNYAYACPMVPSENWLDVRIEAGEKDYPGEPVAPHGQGSGH